MCVKEEKYNQRINRRLASFFHTRTTYVEMFILPLYKLQISFFEKMTVLHTKALMDDSFDFSSASKAPFTDNFLQSRI